MIAWLDDALVFPLLAVSVAYAGFTLAPRNLRRRIAIALKGAVPRTPRALGLGRAMAWLAGAAEARVPGGCGGCDDCGSSPAARVAGTEQSAGTLVTTSRSRAPAPEEIRIPVASIGHRRDPRAR